MQKCRGGLVLLLLSLCFAPSVWAFNAPMADWMQRIRIGGNGAFRFMAGQQRAQLEKHKGFQMNQANVVIDADVASDVSFWYDLSNVREGRTGRTEQMYIRWDSILGQEWFNVKFGRTFMPFGEDYLRWDAIDNPWASMTTAYPWALDEGMLVFGDVLHGGLLSYMASIQNGNATFNFDENQDKTLTFKLASNPLPWIHTGVSYMDLGRQGSSFTKGNAEFWLSGFHMAPMGTTSAAGGASSGNVVNGRAVEGNLRLTHELGPVGSGQFGANYGYMRITDNGGAAYRRTIRWYTTELLYYPPKMDQKLHLGARYSIIGTFNPDQGYRFAGTEFATGEATPYSAYNYNQRDLYRYSAGAGYRFRPNAIWKLEYSWEDSHLIESAKTAANMALRGQRNFFVTELAVKF